MIHERWVQDNKNKRVQEFGTPNNGFFKVVLE